MLTDEQHAWLVSTLKINVRVSGASEETDDGKLMRKRAKSTRTKTRRRAGMSTSITRKARRTSSATA